MPHIVDPRHILASLAFAAGIGIAAAAAPLSYDASTVPFGDGASTVALDLRWDNALVLVFGAESGPIADVVVPNPDTNRYQTLAGRIDATIAPTRSGLVDDVRSGLVVLHDGHDMTGLRASYAQRLRDLGFEVWADTTNPRTLHAAIAGFAYRLVFSYDDGGIRTYIGS